MDILIQNFILQMYWIDITAIMLVTLGVALWIRFHHAPAILQRNIAYNEQLTRLRHEVFNECEKNFFL
mgnify:FL=1